MEVRTCYHVDIKNQLDVSDAGGSAIVCPHKVDGELMRRTADTCLAALKFCAGVFLKEWDSIEAYPVTPSKGIISRRRKGDLLVHSTKGTQAEYPEFDALFPNMPSYMRRAIVADAIGLVSSFVSNHRNWEALSPSERGEEPNLGFPQRYELTFYEQDRDLGRLDEGIIRLKLFDGKGWGWFYFRISNPDARYISRMAATRAICSPTVEKRRGKYRIRFTFKEKAALPSEKEWLSYRILAVDLGINAPASWCVMASDGTVHAKGMIHLPCDEGRLSKMISRKRKYQQAGKKSRCVHRWVTEANRQLSISTAKALMEIAVLYNVDCIVFEHLDHSGKKGSGRYKERIHMWRAADVQKRVETQAHRHGMRISRVCAWNTSRLAYDGSGKTDRHSVYTYVHGKIRYNYSVCTFASGKIYNCDISAAQNIGARYFLRLYAKKKGDRELLPPTPQRTLDTLLLFVCNGLPDTRKGTEKAFA